MADDDQNFPGSTAGIAKDSLSRIRFVRWLFSAQVGTVVIPPLLLFFTSILRNIQRGEKRYIAALSGMLPPI